MQKITFFTVIIVLCGLWVAATRFESVTSNIHKHAVFDESKKVNRPYIRVGQHDVMYPCGTRNIQGVVVFVHGLYGSAFTSIHDVRINTMHRLGWDVLCVEYQSHGTLKNSTNFSWGEQEWLKVASAVNSVSKNTRVVLFGESIGARIVLRYMDEIQHTDVSAVILDSPCLDVLESCLMRAGTPSLAKYSTVKHVVAWAVWGWSGLSLKPSQTFEYGIPAIVFQGTADITCSHKSAIEWCAKSQIHCEVFENGKHVLLHERFTDRYQRALSEFLQNI